MNRRIISASLTALSVFLTLAGCQKSADQQSASDATSSSPDASKSAKKESPGLFESKPLVVPAGTPIEVVLDQTLGSKTSSSGQTFSSTVQDPVEVEGKVAIPKGARASGIVKEAKSAGRFKGGAVLALTLTSVTVDGKEYQVESSSPTMASKGKGKRTAALIGGGGAGGALIGGLAGGGKGAAIGALVGAA